MTQRIHQSTLGTACLLLGLLAGCSKPPYEGPQRYTVSGNVTFDGEVVDGGTISFLPQPGEGHPSGGPVDIGAFSVPEAKGPNAGTYRVAIYWHKPTGKEMTDPDTGETIDVVKQVVPARFNDNTELMVTVSEDSDKNVFDFNLSSK